MRRVTVAIDLGNSMLKAGTYINGKLVFAKLPNKLQYSKTISPKAKVLEKNGEVVYLGVGTLNNNVLKHTRNNLLDQVLVMINELYPNEQNLIVDLKVGLPPAQLFNDTYLSEFEGIFSNKGNIEYTVDSQFKSIEIATVETFAEGYSGFIAIVDKISTKQDILSIDVGGGTIDLCNYQFDYEDDMYYPDQVDTIPLGNIDFSEAVAIYFNNEHGADIKTEQIEHIFKNDLEFIDYEGKQYPLKDYFTKALTPLKIDILNKITNKFGKLDKYAVVGLGGGYKTFEQIIKDDISKSIEIDKETQFIANLLGYLEQ